LDRVSIGQYGVLSIFRACFHRHVFIINRSELAKGASQYVDGAVGLISLNATGSPEVRFESFGFRVDEAGVEAIGDGFEFLLMEVVLFHESVGFFLDCDGFVFDFLRLHLYALHFFYHRLHVFLDFVFGDFEAFGHDVFLPPFRFDCRCEFFVFLLEFEELFVRADFQTSLHCQLRLKLQFGCDGSFLFDESF
jgi:hypothetical protein